MPTTPTQMRLGEAYLGMIDWLAGREAERTKTPAERTEIVRRAIRELYDAEGGPKVVPPPKVAAKKKTSRKKRKSG